jgi:uncharacterized protein (TIGR02246 family)
MDMSKKAILMGIAISMLFALPAMAQSKNAADKPAKSEPVAVAATPTTPSEAEEEAAIRKIVDGFLKAYKEHDAKALAALFVECGEMVDERGDSVCGRQRIENLFKYVFETHPKAELEISVQSIRFLTPSLAVETGTSKAIYEHGESAQHNNYAVIYVKQDGQWLMASARDYPDVAATGADELKCSRRDGDLLSLVPSARFHFERLHRSGQRPRCDDRFATHRLGFGRQKTPLLGV